MRQRVLITGRVQGVGYRASACVEAQRLGLHGWVRNNPHGAVESEFEGDEDSVATLRQWLTIGPRFASVDAVIDMATSEEPLPHPFTIR
jgi:acylphosphatase